MSPFHGYATLAALVAAACEGTVKEDHTALYLHWFVIVAQQCVIGTCQ